MRKILLCALAAVCLAGAAPKKPKLLLAIVVDQFRYDYLTRFRSEYKGGLARLLNKGAVFTNARYIHVPAITAVGHSTFLSGATPSISGIVANDWYDRDEGVHVTSVSDAKTQLLGGKVAAGSSPKRLLVSTIGDELKMAGGGKPRVYGVSLKDRAAILPAGHMADGAFWFDTQSGNFVTSSFYYKELPGWVKEFNSPRPADKYRGKTWLGHKMPEDNVKLFTELEATPFGNELIEAFAERALDAGQLGKREFTDVLTVSFSSNDYVGHRYGPDSREVHEIALDTDRLLEKLFQAVERQVGADNYLVVFTADHGVAPVPEVNAARKMPGGRIDPAAIKAAVQNALVKKYGAGEWVAGNWDLAVYLNQGLIATVEAQSGRGGKGGGTGDSGDAAYLPGIHPATDGAGREPGGYGKSKGGQRLPFAAGARCRVNPGCVLDGGHRHGYRPRVAVQLRYARTGDLHGRGCSCGVNITSPSR